MSMRYNQKQAEIKTIRAISVTAAIFYICHMPTYNHMTRQFAITILQFGALLCHFSGYKVHYRFHNCKPVVF